MRLSQSYQPKTLDEVVGQPAVIRRLKRLVAAPQPCCLLFEGPGGVGKSATAKALVRDLGVDPFYGVNEYAGTDLLIKTCRELFEHTFRLAPMMGARWNVLVIEELERAASDEVTNHLKKNLSEQHMPERLIVVATSNDASGLDEALLQRFEVYPFSAGPSFAEACHERLEWIWEQEVGAGVPLPLGMEHIGWRNGNYSMRRALAGLDAALRLRCEEAPA
jgi:replication-associated recombination protein RarA